MLALLHPPSEFVQQFSELSPALASFLRSSHPHLHSLQRPSPSVALSERPSRHPHQFARLKNAALFANQCVARLAVLYPAFSPNSRMRASTILSIPFSATCSSCASIDALTFSGRHFSRTCFRSNLISKICLYKAHKRSIAAAKQSAIPAVELVNTCSVLDPTDLISGLSALSSTSSPISDSPGSSASYGTLSASNPSTIANTTS